LPQHRGLARHVGTGEQAQTAPGIQRDIVGHEVGRAYHGFHHLVAAFLDEDVGTAVQLGTAPAVTAPHLGKALPVVQMGDDVRHVQDALPLLGHEGT